MLQELFIENFALVEQVRLSLAPGLNVLTGETGAGKSIIVDAMAVLLGGRASQEFIRTGQDRALVEGYFSPPQPAGLEEALLALGISREEDGGLLLSREISRSGRNACRVNGRVVTLSVYQEVGRFLVDLHGQHDHQSLLSSSRQLELLDYFGGKAVAGLREEVAAAYRQARDLTAELSALLGDAREKARQRDLLRYQLEEIDRARLTPGEEEELASQRAILAGAEKLSEGVTRAYGLLFGGEQRGLSAYDLLSSAVVAVKDVAGIDPALEGLLSGVESALYQVEEAALELRRYADRIEFNPQRLSELEARLDTIKRLTRKYGETVAEVLIYREQVAATLEGIEGSQERAAHLEKLRQQAEEKYVRAAARLTQSRREIADKLAASISKSLAELEMPRTCFEVQFLPRTELNIHGAEDVEFCFSPNPGEPLKSLAKIASGGELSRVMLAIKSILAEVDRIPTLIFDEIDAGIGGRTAQSVAQKLARLARYRQVICVTHLAQIASCADQHFSITKEVVDDRTQTHVCVLQSEERVEELVRMLSGEGSALAREHAREMLKAAESSK
ncbi:hypothetical protein SY88_07065 [Clostridiales bacterium PH28_bin88]|nr:hypothetical protein SY88_07065 [Clostridiales bacterium PH28_bin88]